MRSIVHWILRCIMYGLGVFCILLHGGACRRLFRVITDYVHTL